MKRTFTLPDPGEGLIEAEIVEWQVAVGDTVTVNQVLVEVETSKSLVELPSPWAGTVVELLAQVGETIAVGSPIVTIDDGVVTEGALAEGVVAEQAAPEDGAAGSGGGAAERSTAGSGEPAAPVAHEGSGPTLVGYGAAPSATTRRRRVGRGAGRAASPERDAVSTAAVPAAVPAAAVPAAASPVAAVAAAAVPAAASTTARPRSAPIVRRLARDLGVDLAVVTPTRPDGIITRDDVLALAEHTQPSSTRPVETPAPDARVNARVTTGVTTQDSAANARGVAREPIRGVRRAMAQAMVASAFTAPHVTEFLTVDVTATMDLIERLSGSREFEGVKLTPLALVGRAMCAAARRHPGVNASWDEAAGDVVRFGYVNLGIAVATQRGLVVPNIKDADLLGLRDLAAALGTLTDTARAGRATPHDLAGGTMTITNVGVFGVDTGTPILNPGEAVILAFGAVARRPWVVVGPDGTESIEPRWVTQLALSFDHRLVDGELGSTFLADIGALLHDPAQAFVWG